MLMLLINRCCHSYMALFTVLLMRILFHQRFVRIVLSLAVAGMLWGLFPEFATQNFLLTGVVVAQSLVGLAREVLRLAKEPPRFTM